MSTESFPEGTQDEPVMDQHIATREDKVSGIIDQTRVDVRGLPIERVIDVLRQRFSDAGIETDDAELASLAEQVNA
ncbi:hypothetical protein GCM10027058_09280 [Microbacterium neimengense]